MIRSSTRAPRPTRNRSAAAPNRPPEKTQTVVGILSPRSFSGRAHANELRDGQRSSLICPSPILPAPQPSKQSTKDTGSSEPPNKDILDDFHHAFPLVR